MRFNASDIEKADRALVEQEVVKDGKYDKSFKVAISSFGAAVVMSGLRPAIKFYGREQSDMTGEARKILNVLKAFLCCGDNLASCREYDIQRAIIAIKIALKFYSEEKCEETGNSQKSETNNDLKVKKEEDVFNDNETRWKSLESFIENEKVANLGWYFYRRYYKSDIDYISSIDSNVEVKVKKSIRDTTNRLVELDFSESVASMQYIRMNNSISAFTLSEAYCNNPVYDEFEKDTRYVYFDLKTTYPGALLGSGLVHGVGDTNEIKIGFQFDYVSGLPYIPGSSVKGILKSMFAQTGYIKQKLGMNKIEDSVLKSITIDIFGGKLNGETKEGGVIFFDAMIVPEKDSRIVGDDFITPHKFPLKEPKPIQFLKVLPNVIFRFSFLVKKEVKIDGKGIDLGKIFKSILLDNGVGAKTNIGYGRLVEVKKDN